MEKINNFEEFKEFDKKISKKKTKQILIKKKHGEKICVSSFKFYKFKNFKTKKKETK